MNAAKALAIIGLGVLLAAPLASLLNPLVARCGSRSWTTLLKKPVPLSGWCFVLG